MPEHRRLCCSCLSYQHLLHPTPTPTTLQQQRQQQPLDTIPDDLPAQPDELSLEGPAPSPAAVQLAGEEGGTPDCPFTLRVAGQLIPVAQAPDRDRYIISTHTEEQRRQLSDLLAATLPPPTPTYLTDGMPLLVGSLSRADLQWLCQDPVASACIRYIERDEKVSVFSVGAAVLPA